MSEDLEFDSLIIKLIVIGETEVGKTNLIHRFRCGLFKDNAAATIGADVQLKKISLSKDGRPVPVRLQIWDVAGQTVYRSMTKTFARGAKGAICMYDVTKPLTFERIEDWMSLVHKDVPECLFLLVGNKVDLIDQRQISTEDGAALASRIGAQFIETSSLTGENVEAAFELLGNKILLQMALAGEKSASADMPKAIDTRDMQAGSNGCC